MRVVFGVIAGIVMGFILYGLLDKGPSVADHWRIVREYRAYVSDSEIGGSAIELPKAPLPSLAALVAAEELNHIDIVLPNIVHNNSKANRLWMDFCSIHKGIICAMGNPSYVEYPMKDDQPLHLNLWYMKEAKGDISKLISQLEKNVSQTVWL